MFIFFNDTATTEIYTLSLHDALPIWSARRHIAQLCVAIEAYARAPDGRAPHHRSPAPVPPVPATGRLPLGTVPTDAGAASDRKSTRLNSSHANISYAVFCLKKKKHKT